MVCLLKLTHLWCWVVREMLNHNLTQFFIAHILSDMLQYMLTLVIHEASVGYVRAAS